MRTQDKAAILLFDPLWSIFRGPAIYRPKSPWGPIAATSVVALILLVCFVLLPLSLYGLSPDVYSTVTGQAGPPKLWGGSASPGFSLVQQIAVIGLVWLVSGMRRGIRSAVLALNPAKGGARTYILLACWAVIIIFPIGLANVALSGGFWFIRAQSIVLGASGSGMVGLLLNTLVLVVFGPLSEELVFRGFLLSALAKSRIGFWGAALIVNSAWTAMHYGYQPWSNLFVLFIFGLLLTFIIWRTGSLWASIFAHAMNNLLPATSLVLLFIIQQMR